MPPSLTLKARPACEPSSRGPGGRSKAFSTGPFVITNLTTSPLPRAPLPNIRLFDYRRRVSRLLGVPGSVNPSWSAIHLPVSSSPLILYSPSSFSTRHSRSPRVFPLGLCTRCLCSVPSSSDCLLRQQLKAILTSALSRPSLQGAHASCGPWHSAW